MGAKAIRQAVVGGAIPLPNFSTRTPRAVSARAGSSSILWRRSRPRSATGAGILRNRVEKKRPAPDRNARRNDRHPGLQRLRPGDIARMDGAHARQSLGGLLHAEHDLPGDAAALRVHPAGAEVVLDHALGVDAHAGQVVEHQRQIPVEQGPDLPCQRAVDPLGVVHRRVHGAQGMLGVTPCAIAGMATAPSCP